jgi:hypothetical protein
MSAQLRVTRKKNYANRRSPISFSATARTQADIAEVAPLQLVHRVPLPRVKGHLAVDLAGHPIFIAAKINNTAEVVEHTVAVNAVGERRNNAIARTSHIGKLSGPSCRIRPRAAYIFVILILSLAPRGAFT